MTNRHHSAIYETNSWAFSKSRYLEKNHQFEEDTRHQFHKAVVGNSRWEITLRLATDVFSPRQSLSKLIFARLTKRKRSYSLLQTWDSSVWNYGKCQNESTTRWPLSHFYSCTLCDFSCASLLLWAGQFEGFYSGFKILAEFICRTENFNNFVYGNHRFFDCNYLICTYKVTKNKRDYRFL